MKKSSLKKYLLLTGGFVFLLSLVFIFKGNKAEAAYGDIAIELEDSPNGDYIVDRNTNTIMIICKDDCSNHKYTFPLFLRNISLLYYTKANFKAVGVLDGTGFGMPFLQSFFLDSEYF